jgi:hypothetical protein
VPSGEGKAKNRLQKRIDFIYRQAKEAESARLKAEALLALEQKHAADLVAANAYAQGENAKLLDVSQYLAAENKQLRIDLSTAVSTIEQFRVELARARGAKANGR